MKKTIITLLALAGIVSADVYTWNNNVTEGSWATSSNWLNNNGFYPQHNVNDSAVVNAGNVTINWKKSDCGSYFGQANSITLNNGNTLNIFVDGTNAGDLYVSTFNLNDGAKVYVGCERNAIGYKKNFTINYGTFTADSHGLFDAATKMTGTLYSNNFTITLTGTFNTQDLLDKYTPGAENSGSITLYTSASAAEGAVTVNTDALVIQEVAGVTVEKVWEGNTLKLNYTVIPEPTTATLSLLALAGLAARRRRR